MVFQYADVNWAWSSTHHHARSLKKYPNIECLGEVIEHSWGQRVIRFYDLDGHIIEVGENMKMVIKRFLASGMTIDEVSVKMDVSFEDLTKLQNS